MADLLIFVNAAFATLWCHEVAEILFRSRDLELADYTAWFVSSLSTF